MDDNLAQLFAYAESKRASENPVDTEAWEGPSHHRFHASNLRRGGSATEMSGMNTKRSLLRHADTAPNLFREMETAIQNLDDQVEKDSRNPRLDSLGVMDANLAEMFAYSARRKKEMSDMATGSPFGAEAEESRTRHETMKACMDSQTPASSHHDAPSEVETAQTWMSPFVTVQKVVDGAPDGEGQHQTDTEVRPKYAGQCCEGWATEEVRRFWFERKNKGGEEANSAAYEGAMSLVASCNMAEPIYYWQLFSVMGEARIEALVRTFYENIYNDDEDPRLRRAFQRLPGRSGLEHHVRAQTAFWIDAFGGGRKYAGGWDRVEFHHRYGAGEVMNVEGATRWALHMNRAMATCDLTDDPRVRGCLAEFLKIHMDKYGAKFKFDTSHIKFGDSGLRGAVRTLNRLVGSWKQTLFTGKDQDRPGSSRSFKLKEKEKEAEGKPERGAKGRWGLVRSAVKGAGGKKLSASATRT